MKKYLLAGVLVFLLAAILAMPLAAAEKGSVKIKLPDGVYMYNAYIEQLKSGDVSIRFQNFFLVQNNIIYSSREAIKKFGEIKLNELFTENKKYKILLGEEKIGEIHSLRISDSRGPYGHHKTYKQVLFSKDIKQGPAYVANQYLRTGSAAMYLAVPEAYKEVKKKVYTTIPQEEVKKVSKLIEEKLFNLVKNRKEFSLLMKNETELYKEKLEHLDKISKSNEELYIGTYQFFIDGEIYHIIFSIRKDNVFIVTSNHDGKLSWDLILYGMLDVDGCGEEDLIIEKVYPSEDEVKAELEMYKIEDDGNWLLIKKTSN